MGVAGTLSLLTVQAVSVVLALGCDPSVVCAQSNPPVIELTLAVGHPILVTLDHTIRLTAVGQPVAATIAEPVYAYDRIVLPVGAPVHGHVAKLVGATKSSRLRAMLSGSLSPPRRVVLDFDSVIVDGQSIPIHSAVVGSAAHLRRQTAREDKAPGLGTAVKQREEDALAAIKEPGKMARLKEALLNHLPYHPQYLNQGTVFTLELQAPMSLGAVVPTTSAPLGALPAPDSVLSARLTTPLSSASSARGAPVVAVVVEPVFSKDHELILPEGAELDGEVTFAKPARRWHRSGQLRILFEQVKVAPTDNAVPMLASLYSVEASQETHLSLDEEGGASATNPKTRFIAPALSVAALNGSFEQHTRRFDNDGDPYDVAQIPEKTGGGSGRSLGGFLGFGVIGIALSQASRPVGIAFAVAGAARTIFTNIVGRGQEISFGPDTPVQVRLAPGRSGGK